MNLFAILSNIRLPDLLDILFISIVSYQFYHWFRGTKAFKALIGIILLSGVFIVAKFWGLFLTTWVFQMLWQVFVILLIILFQKEIRQMLERFNPLKNFGDRKSLNGDGWIPGFADWAFDAAEKRMGALIIFEMASNIGINMDWKQKIVDPDVVMKKIRPGMSIFLGTGISEPRTLVEYLMNSDEGNLADLELIQLVNFSDTISLKTLDAHKFRLETFSSVQHFDAAPDGVVVRCGRGTAIKITEVQREGRRRMPVDAFLIGERVSHGEAFG